MKIAFFVNDVDTERPEYTTTRLALRATNSGHDVWYIGAGDFAYDPDDSINARARRVEPAAAKDLDTLLETVTDEANDPERIPVDDLDVLFLRNDPSDDPPEHSWQQTVGILFGQLAVQRGVVVVNDPTGLSKALNKMYFHHFPTVVRPRTLVTRDRDEVHAFVSDHGGSAVLKPLQGSGGQNVFLVKPGAADNLNQMIDAITRDGYLVAQEYVPDAEKGDVRLFVMDGEPLVVDGAYAAFRRTNHTDDFRSNMSVGAESGPVEIDASMLGVVDQVRDQLVADGMFLVGLDLLGDKLVEANVFSPGGLGSAEKFTGVDFTAAVIEALEARVERGRRRPGTAA